MPLRLYQLRESNAQSPSDFRPRTIGKILERANVKSGLKAGSYTISRVPIGKRTI